MPGIISRLVVVLLDIFKQCSGETIQASLQTKALAESLLQKCLAFCLQPSTEALGLKSLLEAVTRKAEGRQSKWAKQKGASGAFPLHGHSTHLSRTTDYHTSVWAESLEQGTAGATTEWERLKSRARGGQTP